MTDDDKGNLYVGHYTVYPGATPTTSLSVVNVETGSVSEIKTVPNPMTVRIKNGKIYVGSYSDHKMDVFDLNTLKRITTITFDEKVIIPANNE
ncbi:hypothetical protein BP422_04850 [Brevibacillus formosus]|uniref:Uncharacterized protein n=1 Tax=Brevibacillus formosus TaxID=54913 RepID=A0A220MD72_9BACL|nr:hypothetical protein [Brevibacillus formosus]ASJ52938.1 hypothetical protein BP422_04850 [Brevibacillus formosus]